MQCPICNNNISVNHLIINDLSCPRCNSYTTVLANHIHKYYKWICYIIKHNNIIKYVGYTTSLSDRIKSHLSSEIIYKILNKRIYYKDSSFKSNNISIAISLILSERTLAHIYKPIHNMSYNNTDTKYRINKDNKLVEYNIVSDNSIIQSLLLTYNKPNTKETSYKITQSFHINNVGDVMAYSFTKIDKYNNMRSYCYRWQGTCHCSIPCKYVVEIIILKASINKSIDITKELDVFKQNKIDERNEILKYIAPSAINLCKSLDSSYLIMKQYKKEYLEYINTKMAQQLPRNKPKLPTTNEELREYAKLSFELTPYITNISKLSDTTLKNYNTYINTVAEKYTAKLHKPFDNPFTFVKYPFDIINLLNSNYKPTTVVSHLSAIIWRLRKAVSDKEEGIEPLDIYIYILLQKEAHAARDKHEQETAGKLTKKEQENFLPWETILEVRSKMEKALDIDKFNDFTDFIIVCLYTYNPPTRADYANMRVFVFDEDVPTDFKDNYCVVGSPTPRFVFWKYKTATGKEPAVNEIPDELVEILYKWLEVNTTEYLLVSKIGGGAAATLEPMKENTLCTRVRSIFKRWAGKEASINTLRHAFISYNSRFDQVITEKEENARKMMHSTSMADKYRRYVY